MELHLRFTGLCLFIKDKDQAGRPICHVLMPATGPHGTHVKDHVAMLSYSGAPRVYNLHCRYLDLTGIKATAGYADLSHVIDVGSLISARVKRERVGTQPGPTVFARVTIPVPTRTLKGDVAEWAPVIGGVEHQKLPLTHHMTWIYENFDPSSLVMQANALHATCPTTKHETPLDERFKSPKSSGSVFCLAFMNLPSPSGSIGIGNSAPHFPAYFRVFDPEPTTLPKLKLKRERPGPPSPIVCPGSQRLLNGKLKLKRDVAEQAYNCMLAKADLG